MYCARPQNPDAPDMFNEYSGMHPRSIADTSGMHRRCIADASGMLREIKFIEESSGMHRRCIADHFSRQNVGSALRNMSMQALIFFSSRDASRCQLICLKKRLFFLYYNGMLVISVWKIKIIKWVYFFEKKREL